MAPVGTSVTDRERDELISCFSFGIPTDEALTVIAEESPDGVLELGAGTGYWAALLARRGVDIVAVDRFPAPSSANPWFAGRKPWLPLVAGDERLVEFFPERSLLLVWPTRDETWAADAALRHHAAGGECLLYVGEGPGGLTGDDRFHALVGAFDRCVACAYGVLDAVCICGVAPLWSPARTVDLPHWLRRSDRLVVYRRVSGAGPPLSPAGPRTSRERGSRRAFKQLFDRSSPGRY